MVLRVSMDCLSVASGGTGRAQASDYKEFSARGKRTAFEDRLRTPIPAHPSGPLPFLNEGEG